MSKKDDEIVKLCKKYRYDSMEELIKTAQMPNCPHGMKIEVAKFVVPYQYGVPVQKVKMDVNNKAGVIRTPQPHSMDSWKDAVAAGALAPLQITEDAVVPEGATVQ